MKTHLSFLTIFFFSTGLFAQTFVQHYYKVLPGLGTHSAAHAILLTQDNNLFIAGPSSTISGPASMFYIKTDTAGNVLQTTFSDSQFDNTDQTASRLLEDANNNFRMIGNYSYYSQTYFTKLSSTGQPLSTHVNGGWADYQGGADMVPMQDNGFLVSANYDDYAGGDHALALRKLDGDGNFIWDTTLAYPTPSDRVYGFCARMSSIDDSTVAITGTRDYAYGGAQNLDMFLMKIRFWNDSVKILSLNIIEKTGTNEHGYDVKTLPNNQGYIVCGDGQNDDNTSYWHGIITRIDIAGNVVWKKTYSRSVNSDNRFVRVVLDNNGDIIVLARTNGGSEDVTLMKYSLDGNLLEVAFFDVQQRNEIAYDMTIGPDNKIYVSAGIFSLTAPKALLLCVGNGTATSSPSVPLSNWALIIGILLIAVFMVVKYRRRLA